MDAKYIRHLIYTYRCAIINKDIDAKTEVLEKLKELAPSKYVAFSNESYYCDSCVVADNMEKYFLKGSK